MSLVYAQGWELGAAQGFYEGAGWSTSGTMNTRYTTTTSEHPDGYGGGDFSLAQGEDDYIQCDGLFSCPNTCTVNTMLYATSTFLAGEVALAMKDSNGDSVAEIRAVDAATSTRLAILHAGVTVDTTPSYMDQGSWTRLALQYSKIGAQATISLYMNGILRASGSTVLTTGLTVTGLRWGAINTGNTVHDHTVVYDTTGPATLKDTWIQGLVPNADNTNGSWTANPGGNTYDMVSDSNDSNYMEVASASAFDVQLEGRTDVDAGWTDPEVVAVQVDVAAYGDGSLTDGRAEMHLGASTLVGSTVTVSASGGLAHVLSENKPGGSGWAATDLDNLLAGYRVA